MWKSQERLSMDKDIILQGDCLTSLKTLPDNSINCCITSPPYYGLRDYGVDGQIGLEDTPELFIDNLVNIFREVKRVLKDDGTLWVNIGDSYNCTPRGSTDIRGKQSTNLGSFAQHYSKRVVDSCKQKDLMGIPWMLAFALRDDGWYLRQDIIWHKPNPMPESVMDRFTKSHEYIFLFSKNPQYYFDYEAIQEPANIQNPSSNIKFGGNKYGDDESPLFGYYSGDDYKPRTKNCQYDGQTPNTMHINREKGLPDKEYVVRQKRDVWSINPAHYKEAHFATFPEELVKPMILSGCPKDGIVLDPFMGSGTVGAVAKKLYRNYVGCELNPEYVKMAENRIGIVTTKVNSRLFDLM